MNGEGFRNTSSMVGALSLYAQLDALVNALPASFKFFLAAVFAALGNLLVEYLRVRAAEYRARRAQLEQPAAEPVRDSIVPPGAP